MTPAQRQFIERHRRNMDVETFMIHKAIPAGSEVLIGRGKDSGRIFWFEILEPDSPTALWAYDTGDAR